jgi:hypothetical protein
MQIELTEAQVELVSAYIKQNGVAQDELHDDLLDHVCTSMEQRMQQGESFEEAFQYTLSLFGPGGLKQVQNETFELLTEMNATMKKVTFGFGLTSTFLLLAGTIFKLLHWPGANVMFMIGAVILALIYLPLILRHKLKESPNNEALLHISGFVGLAFTTVGSLFKIMHWPGASVTLMIGLGTLAFLYVPIYFYKRYQTSANKPITLSASLVAMTCLILVFALTRVNNSENYDYGLTLIDSHLRTSVENTSNNKLLYTELADESRANEIRNAASNAINQLRLTRATIIASVDNISMDEAAHLKLSEVRNSSDYKTPTELLFNAAEGESVSIESLVNELNAFKEVVVGTYSPNLQRQVETTFPFNTNTTFTEDGEQMNWAEYSFYKVPVFGVLSNLSKLESEIRQAENQALIYLISRPEASNPPS